MWHTPLQILHKLKYWQFIIRNQTDIRFASLFCDNFSSPSNIAGGEKANFITTSREPYLSNDPSLRQLLTENIETNLLDILLFPRLTSPKSTCYIYEKFKSIINIYGSLFVRYLSTHGNEKTILDIYIYVDSIIFNLIYTLRK